KVVSELRQKIAFCDRSTTSMEQDGEHHSCFAPKQPPLMSQRSGSCKRRVKMTLFSVPTLRSVFAFITSGGLLVSRKKNTASVTTDPEARAPKNTWSTIRSSQPNRFVQRHANINR